MSGLRDRLSEIMKAQDRCDFLTAYDLAMAAHADHPESLGVKYHAVLSLTRLGLAAKAWELHEQPGWELGKTSQEDRAALAGTLALYRAHVALPEPTDSDPSHIKRAAELFPRAYDDVTSIGASLVRERAWRAAALERELVKQSVRVPQPAARLRIEGSSTPVVNSASDYKRHARLASRLYAQTYEETREISSGINAAAMYLLAGDTDTASSLAYRVMAGDARRSAPGKRGAPDGLKLEVDCDLFVARAIRALLSEDFEAFSVALKGIVTHQPRKLAQAAIVWRQVSSVCEEIAINLEHSKTEANLNKAGIYRNCLQQIPQPSLIHYGGHMISVDGAPSRFPQSELSEIESQIAKFLEDHHVGAGYGGLACGADILFAEALLDRGAELHVVIPFQIDDFVDTSVRRAGGDWLRRFDKCRERASSLTHATEDECLGDESLFALGSDVAMGMANSRQHVTGLPLRQILVWDGEKARGRAGTYALKARWAAAGLTAAEHIPCGRKRDSVDTSIRPARSAQIGRREVKALLFGDVKGFSDLKEELVPKFWEVVIVGITKTLEEFQNECNQPIEYWNTWGDAVYIVVKSVCQGAECALRLQERLKNTDFEAAGLPPTLSMRFGAHVGPVYENNDPVTGLKTWHGSHVSRAARIEPITDPGEIFVSEPFAHVLALEAYDAYDCEYLGVKAAAKKYGEFRMYRLRRRPREGVRHQEQWCPIVPRPSAE